MTYRIRVRDTFISWWHIKILKLGSPEKTLTDLSNSNGWHNIIWRVKGNFFVSGVNQCCLQTWSVRVKCWSARHRCVMEPALLTLSQVLLKLPKINSTCDFRLKPCLLFTRTTSVPTVPHIPFFFVLPPSSLGETQRFFSVTASL
jgi:hypothetical protein